VLASKGPVLGPHGSSESWCWLASNVVVAEAVSSVSVDEWARGVLALLAERLGAILQQTRYDTDKHVLYQHVGTVELRLHGAPAARTALLWMCDLEMNRLAVVEVRGAPFPPTVVRQLSTLSAAVQVGADHMPSQAGLVGIARLAVLGWPPGARVSVRCIDGGGDGGVLLGEISSADRMAHLAHILGESCTTTKVTVGFGGARGDTEDAEAPRAELVELSSPPGAEVAAGPIPVEALFLVVSGALPAAFVEPWAPAALVHLLGQSVRSLDWGLLGLVLPATYADAHAHGAGWALRVMLAEDESLHRTIAREAGNGRHATLLCLITLPQGSQLDDTAVAAGVRRALARAAMARSATLFSRTFTATRALSADIAAGLRSCNLHQVVDLADSGQVDLHDDALVGAIARHLATVNRALA
jgi:hypothetical protein